MSSLILYTCLFSSIICISLLFVSTGFYFTSFNYLFNGLCWSLVGMLDYINLGIILMLCICFSYAYFYTGHYFSNTEPGKELNYIIILFVGVMFTLVLTGDYLTTLILWEYLGVVSYFLILFYMSYLSLRSSVVTLVSSRFGDVCLFLLIALSAYNNYYLVSCSILFFFIIFTKSAGFPFISWLLEAMRAPTPVSSLVHSSTLVAAGVWFAMRYDVFLYFDNVWYFYIILLTTVFITGICCFFFLDLKKIVALSTCNNISWCLIYLIFGDVTLSLFQLVSHGVSKCLLFMLVGDVMSGTGGSQASNCVYSPRIYGNLGIFGLFSVILGLSGAPFIGVFFTKHFLLTGFNSFFNLPLFVFLMLCVFLSYFYSFRFCTILLNTKISIVSGVSFTFTSGLLVYIWLMINYFIAGSLDELSTFSSNGSMLLIIFQLTAIFTSILFYNSVVLSSWSSSLFGCDNLVELIYQTFNYLYYTLGLFFFRWDNYTINLFQGNGTGFINILNYNLLNLIMFSFCLFLIVWSILL
uniref:NADH:ubiquinone reductase (H(+)-translocating) n=1 Tax=Dollfusiella sp. MZUSP 7992 TaxID=2899499 RepID=A0A8K1SYL0_9CEST|nr:NADH dehydrogenase subunit 5 [Dollfusiella sp. MZUSP 7992]